MTAEREVTPALVDAILATYLDALADEVARASAFRVLPGVDAVLRRLARVDGVAVGLGTGNLRRGAQLKLARAALDARFAFGGFGCDHEDRAELLRIGAARGAATLGVGVDDCRIVVVGDTPLDVAAARAIGAECVAVGTSGVALDVLRAAGATHVFADLTETGVPAALAEGSPC
jgi:phosphoglycolate phosphatase